ncbi:MAG: hypothetical protein ACSHX9_07825 [Luteolibacter sp.]
MTDKLQQNFKEVGRDLETRWVDLSKEVRILSAELRTKSADSALFPDVDNLASKADHLCDHVERMHADVLDLLENLDSRIGLSPKESPATPEISCDEIEKEKIQIQREQHGAQANIKDVIKALFMYVDDPKERVVQKK